MNSFLLLDNNKVLACWHGAGGRKEKKEEEMKVKVKIEIKKENVKNDFYFSRVIAFYLKSDNLVHIVAFDAESHLSILSKTLESMGQTQEWIQWMRSGKLVMLGGGKMKLIPSESSVTFYDGSGGLYEYHRRTFPLASSDEATRFATIPPVIYKMAEEEVLRQTGAKEMKIADRLYKVFGGDGGEKIQEL